LRVLVDRSVIEVFANGRQAIMRRIYPKPDSRVVRAFDTGGKCALNSFRVWEMMPSNLY
jgi:beta-fructofuranosidase